MSGDPRFKSYSKSNPRKMVKMWAEKELRNLARLHAAGIRCPKPLQLRTHVLVMEFIGQQGVAALRLKVQSCFHPKAFADNKAAIRYFSSGNAQKRTGESVQTFRLQDM